MSIHEHLLIKPEGLEFIEQIGGGAYSTVWRAKWNGQGGGVYVAVKRISINYDTFETRSLLLRELNILAELRHPNVIAVFGACFVNGVFWIVMELMQGGSLYQFLQESKKITWDERLRLAHMIAQAVVVLHSHMPPILHRDIKSPNLLFTKDVSVVKLIDFGLSKYVSVVSSDPREALGTPRWSAPETFEYPPKWSTASDIYSLGMVFYEIASGKIPFGEIDDNMRVMFIVKLENRPEIPNDCPKEFAKIIKMCWAHEPHDRLSAYQVLELIKIIASTGSLEDLNAKDDKVTVADKLELITIMGTNDFSEVWQAKWNEFGEITVAVKKLPVRNLLEEKNILNEVNILSKFRHPNIVLIYETHFVANDLWIVMEFMEGGNLFDFLQTNPDWTHRLKLAYQATKALNVLHSGNPSIIHRNIKAVNFLLSKDLSNLKLSDIGISKLAGILSIQQYGNIRWTAPETLQNPLEWTTKSDIYSLGMTFFEISALQIPFKEVENDLRVKFHVLNEKRPSLDNITGCPKEFVDIIKQCWHADANKRPTSSQLLENFKTFIIQEEISTFHIIEYPLTNGMIIQNDNLECIEKVGASVSSEVWKAAWKMNDKKNPVAIKKLLICGTVQKCVEALISYIDILCSIRHPTIVNVYGACVHTTEVWIVMEFMAGGSLYNFLHTSKQIAWNIQLRFAYHATKAIHELHSTGYLHKDIKSLKFLLSEDGSVLKLGSFGLSKLAATAVSSRQHDENRSICWGAPETFTYPPTFSIKSDIYSLGCVFYEIMSQEIPYEKIENLHEIITQIITYKHPIIPKYPQNFDQLILQCWERDPSDRPTTEQILTTLKTLLDNILSLSTTVSSPENTTTVSSPVNTTTVSSPENTTTVSSPVNTFIVATENNPPPPPASILVVTRPASVEATAAKKKIGSDKVASVSKQHSPRRKVSSLIEKFKNIGKSKDIKDKEKINYSPIERSKKKKKM